MPVAQRTRLFGNGTIEFDGSNSTIGPDVPSPGPSPGSVLTSGHPLVTTTSRQARNFCMETQSTCAIPKARDARRPRLDADVVHVSRITPLTSGHMDFA